MANDENMEIETHAQHDEPVLVPGMVGVKELHGMFVQKDGLGLFKGQAVLPDILLVFLPVPLEPHISHMYIVHSNQIKAMPAKSNVS